MSQLSDYEHRMLIEAQDQTRLIASIESKFSFLFWWAMIGVVLFCILMSAIAYAAYLVIDGMGGTIPIPAP